MFCGPDASPVIIQEKVDGANLGFTIDATGHIRAQNRSHFVSSETHVQFATLDAWIDAHRAELFQVLEPERHVLFGEWCRAKHSILYTALPDVFLAFDVYDRRTGRFWTWAQLTAALQDTSIATVRRRVGGFLVSHEGEVVCVCMHGLCLSLWSVDLFCRARLSTLTCELRMCAR